MANKGLMDLPAVGTLAGAQVMYLVDENNNSRRVALSDLAQWIKTAASIVPASNPWKGTRVKLSANLSLATATGAAVTWAAIDLDNGGYWSSGAPTRFTVPSGVTKVRLAACLRWAGNATGNRFAFIRKNGASYTMGGPADTRTAATGGASWPTDQNIVSGVLSVVAGDYFELVAQQNSGSSLALDFNVCWFEVNTVEGS